MAIGTYTELQAAVSSWLDAGTDVSTNVTNFIALGESWLNAELPLIFQEETDATITGTPASRSLTLPARFVEAMSLRLTTFAEERELRPDIAGQMPLSTISGTPSAWAVDGPASIQLDRPCDQAHTFSLRYRKKLDIATDSTNWLLTNYPNAYLYASLVEAAMFTPDPEAAALWQARLDKIMAVLRALDSRNKSVAVLTVDPGLMSRRGLRFNYDTGLPV